MADLVKPYTFTDATDAEAGEVNGNFDALFDWVNQQSIDIEAARAFTSIPAGPATDPTSGNQFTRKAYVDARYRVLHRSSNANPYDGIGAADAIPGALMLHTFVAGRIYRFTAKALLNPTGGFILAVYEGSTELLRLDQNNAATTSVMAGGEGTLNDLAGAKTLVLKVGTALGGLLNVDGEISPTEFLIEDLGTA